MMRAIVLSLLCVALAGCIQREGQVAFDGHFFRATAKPLDRGARDVFEVRVRQANRSETGAREAAAHEATSYCIHEYGSSALTWQTDPSDTAVEIVDNTLIVQGTCAG